jgi:hypothetical protein
MRTTSLCLAAATFLSLGLASSAFAAGELATDVRRTNLNATTDRIEFFLRNTQLGDYAGSSRILAAEITLVSDKPMTASLTGLPPFLNLPVATQTGLTSITGTTTVAGDIFGVGTSFTFGGGVTPLKIEYTGFDSTDPKGTLATSAVNGGRGAGLVTVIAQKDAVVTLSGRAGNEFYQAAGALEGGLEAVFYTFPTVTAAIPEPTSLAVVGLGAAVALRRRSR